MAVFRFVLSLGVSVSFSLFPLCCQLHGVVDAISFMYERFVWPCVHRPFIGLAPGEDKLMPRALKRSTMLASSVGVLLQKDVRRVVTVLPLLCLVSQHLLRNHHAVPSVASESIRYAFRDFRLVSSPFLLPLTLNRPLIRFPLLLASHFPPVRLVLLSPQLMAMGAPTLPHGPHLLPAKSGHLSHGSTSTPSHLFLSPPPKL